MKLKGILILLCLFALIVNSPTMGQTPEERLAIHGAQLAALNAHDLDTMMSYWAEDGIYDYVSMPPPVPVAYVRMGFEQRFAARPDFRMTEGNTFAADNIVVEEAMTLYTVLETGVEVVIPHLSIYEFENDKIKRVTSYNDRAGIAVQLGQMPAPALPELVPSFALPDAEPTGLSPVEADIEHMARYNGSGNVSYYAQMLHPDAQIFVCPLGRTVNRDEWIALHEMNSGGFSDGSAEVVRRVDLGDGWILSEAINRGTHDGSYFGVEPSGYMMEFRGAYLAHYDADGLITHFNMYYDNLTLMTQITTAPWPLDGIWISTVPTPLGNLTLTTMYVAQDAAKTRYSGSLDEINQMPLLADIYPDADPISQWAGGQADMVGRNKYEATYLGYSRKTIETEIGKMNELVGVFTIKAHFELLDPDTLQGQGTGSYYLIEQDADRDGFPDEGQEPLACIPWAWTGKRLTPLPGCTPPPME